MSKPQSTPRELAPEGTHPAVCTGVIDIGTQVVTFKGKEKKQKKLYIEFELQGVERENGDPFIVSLRVTNSDSDKSTLTKTLKSWLSVKQPAAFDLEECVGKSALVTVTHSEDGQYANLENVSALPKGMKVGKPVSELRSLFLDDTFNEEVFESLGDKLKEKIMSSPEYDEVTAAKKSKKAPAKKGKK